MESKLERFAELLEKEHIEYLREHDLGCDANIANARVSIKPGKKYVKVDVGRSGKYMIDGDIIYGIKAYGVIHRGHCYGTLDTIDQYYWGDYTAVKK